MQKIIYDYDCLKRPNTFEEQDAFSEEAPYSICFKRFPTNDIVPLHYAKAIEILFCENLSGTLFIEDTTYELGGKQVFIIPPKIVHSNDIRACSGEMIVLKISLPHFSHYMHLDRYFSLFNCSIEKAVRICPDYDGCRKFLNTLIARDADLAFCIPTLLSLVHHFTLYEAQKSSAAPPSLNNAGLQALVSWTDAHFHEKIKLDDVAAFMGYSKHHFCSVFKSLTGMTYFNYLNAVRISNACLLLSAGKSVQEVSVACGFESPSYFIQVFKRAQLMTPLAYRELAKRSSSK